MDKKIILITGGLSGIGRAAALAFAKQGDTVVVAGRRETEGKALEAELQSLGGEALFVRTDVRQDDEIAALVDQTVSRFGRIDAAINAAGTEGQPGLITDQTAESYAATFDTNVLGTLLSMKHEIRVMQRQGHGNIVNVSSTFGQRGGAYASVYVASKHAVEGFTKSAALETAGSGIRVNAVAPGATQTDMLDRFTGNEENKAGLLSTVPMKRAGHVDELAGAIVFLASDQAGYMTGQVLGVDGGKLAA
jgi:NAD(P)-dependent dehydrogenase (short-subunit alcohol dehydrogenase family)